MNGLIEPSMLYYPLLYYRIFNIFYFYIMLISRAKAIAQGAVHVLTLYLIETPINTFANRVDPDQAALVRAA